MIDPEFVLRIEDGITDRPGRGRETKNDLRFASKLDKPEIREVMKQFALDRTPQQCASVTGISLKTIYAKYAEIRYVFAEGARYRTDMFGGAGALLFLGVPPFDVRERINNYKVQRRIRKPLNYVELFERLVRIYARWQTSDNLQTLVLGFALNRAAAAEPHIKNLFEFLRVFGRFAVIQKNWAAGERDQDPEVAELWKMLRECPQRTEDSYRRMLQRDLRWLVDRCGLSVPAPQWRLDNREFSTSPDGMKEMVARLQAAARLPASGK